MYKLIIENRLKIEIMSWQHAQNDYSKSLFMRTSMF